MNKIFEHVGVQLKYDDLSADTQKSGRVYTTPDGKKYPSVTTVLGYRDRYKWAEWRKAIGEEEANRITRHATTRGTAIHNIAERYINNEEDFIREEGDKMPHVQFGWNTLKSVIDKYIGKVYMQECPLYSDDLKIAGRVDCIAEFGGELSIIDFKTSSRVKNASDISNYFMQECAYSIMFKEHTDIDIKQLVTLMVVDNDPKPIIFVEKRDDWEERLRKEIQYYYSQN
jgi:genome maintenance exonuclease 1